MHAWRGALLGLLITGGCAGVSAPILQGALQDDPAEWKRLPPAERYERAWNYHRHGVDYAHNAALREDARLLASGARRAAVGLEVCATVALQDAARASILEVAKGYRSLERISRGGRLFRPRRTLQDLERQALQFRPGGVELVAGPAPEQPARPPSKPVAAGGIVKGTVLRKRTEIEAGAGGEVTTYILTVLKSGGATVDVAVAEGRWKAAVIGDPVPPPAGDSGGAGSR